MACGFAALAAEICKHNANDAKCSELGWTCAVETYECWGAEAMQTLSHLNCLSPSHQGKLLQVPCYLSIVWQA